MVCVVALVMAVVVFKALTVLWLNLFSGRSDTTEEVQHTGASSRLNRVTHILFNDTHDAAYDSGLAGLPFDSQIDLPWTEP